jgi:hypothetical protein
MKQCIRAKPLPMAAPGKSWVPSLIPMGIRTRKDRKCQILWNERPGIVINAIDAVARHIIRMGLLDEVIIQL